MRQLYNSSNLRFSRKTRSNRHKRQEAPLQLIFHGIKDSDIVVHRCCINGIGRVEGKGLPKVDKGN